MKTQNRALKLAKRELNLLYTEPPAFRNGGGDEGWFCREHAYHTHFLLRLLGDQSMIKVGHFMVKSSIGIITSYTTDCDHSWCIAGDVAPIDLSMDFRFRNEMPQIDGPVVGSGMNVGPYAVNYFNDSPSFEQWAKIRSSEPSIGFVETSFEMPNERALLDNPGLFFLPSDSGGWLHLYGPELFCRITMHVYKVAQGHISPLAGRLNSRAALDHIKGRYPASRLKIHELLK